MLLSPRLRPTSRALLGAVLALELGACASPIGDDPAADDARAPAIDAPADDDDDDGVEGTRALSPPHLNVGDVPTDPADPTQAVPTGDGQRALTLEVFAPFATRMAVAGTFNDWSPDAALLEKGDDGTWRGSVTATPGDRYRLVVDGPAGRLSRIDPRAEAVTNSVGDGLVVDDNVAWSDAAFSPAAWKKAVVYELHAGTFVDDEGGRPGTLDTAITRLDDLSALGVTHIELMPVAEFAGDYSWGYNPAHLFAVEQAYGGPAALDRFVDAAHARGIAVLLDVIYNHLGPSDVAVWRFDGWHEGNGGGVYFYTGPRGDTPWGPRPDFGRPAVRELLKDNARFWLERHHLDGLRLDSTGNIRARLYGNDPIPDGWRLLQEMNDDVHAVGARKKMIAEDLAGLSTITDDTSAGGAGFDSQWDAAFVHPVRAALITPDDRQRSMASVKNAITHAPGFDRVIYTENHDEVANGHARVPEEIAPGDAASVPSQQRALLGIAILLTSPGVPMLFQGQEFLEDGYFKDTDPLDWSKRTSHDDVWSATRDLIALRKNVDGNTAGLTGVHVNVHHTNDNAKVIAFHRFDAGGPGDDVVVIANFANRTFDNYVIGFPHCGAWHVRNGDGTVEATTAARDGMACSAGVRLAPYGAVVLSQDP